MATQALHSHDFPPGTVVSAYLREQIVNGGPPTGVAVTSATVDAAGALAFTGLTEGRRYVAYAGGRGVSFFMAPGSTDTLRPMTSAEAALLRTGTVKNSTDADPINTASIFHGIGGYNPDGSGLPNFAQAPTVKFSTGGIYTDTDTGNNNIFHHAAYAYNNALGAAPTVALFGFGKGDRAFGLNAVGYTDGHGTAQGAEIDYGNVGVGSTTISGDQALPAATLTVASTAGAAATGIVLVGGNYGRYTGITGTTFTGITWEVGGTGTVTNGTAVSYSIGGTATGLTIVAEGGNIAGSPPGPLLQLQANVMSQAQHGINFNASSRPAVVATGTLIRAFGEVATTGVGFSGSKFSSAAATLPVNSGGTGASVGLIVQAEGGFANAGEAIRVAGSGAGSSVANGLVFRLSGGIQPVSGALIKAVGAVSAVNALDVGQATFSGAAIVLGEGHNIQVGTVTGTKFGTGATSKIGLYGKAPVVQAAAIATPTAPSAAYVQAEAQSMKTAVDAIRTALTNIGITA